jgi:photosystem II stability/assembly factor-like uncharacterized protein
MRKEIVCCIVGILLIVPTLSMAGIASYGDATTTSSNQGVSAETNLVSAPLSRSSVSITITPYNPPIIIPVSGGTFQYSIEVTNNDDMPVSFEVWTIFTFPNGTSSSPVYGPVDFELPAMWSATRDNLTTTITAQMPAGTYTYTAYTGVYPDDIWSSDSFTFEKLSESSGWYQQSPDLDATLNAVCFPDTEHGWAVSNSGTILHTSNGGDTWYQQDDGQYYNQIYQAVYFVDDQTGWIAGTKILKTTNGGANWSEQLDPSYSIYGLYFLDANNGWAVGGVFDSYNELFVHFIYHTSDGGNTWTSQYYESGYYYDPVGPFNDVYFADANHGWAVGYDASIFATTDGGANWVEQDSGISGTYYNELYSVAFTDINHGWASGEDGTLLNTIDGGINWNTYDLGTGDELNSIVFTDANNGWIAASGYYPIHGNIFHTEDGGVTWALQDTGTGEEEYLLNDLWFVDATQGWAAGGTFYPWEAVMLHTETGGGDLVYPELAYTPTALDYGEMYNSQEQNITMEIWNGGTGTLWYYLYVDAYGAQYLSFTPDEGFSTGEHDAITATLFTGGLQPGTYQWNVTLYSNDGTVIIPVDVTIIESEQILAYYPHEYDFGDVPQYSLVTTNLSIWNAGTGTMYYWIDDSGTFCVVEPWSGSSQGEVNNHTIMCFTSSLAPGPHQCNLTIHWSIYDPPGIVTIYVNVTPSEGGNYPSTYSYEDSYNEALSKMDQEKAPLDDDVGITITPYNPPITIPASGGTFIYGLQVTNNEITSSSFDVWTVYTFPNGTEDGPFFGPAGFQLPEGWSAIRNGITQSISGSNPPGTYTYTSYVGVYPNDIWNSDSFTFEKLSETSGWYQQVPNLDKTLNAVSFPDTEHGWAVSSSDKILYTSNGGDTWYEEDDGLYYNEVYNAVYFVDDQVGWIAGSKILKTTDGGANWTEQFDPSYSIYGLFFLDANNGWAVGGVFDSYNELFVHFVYHTSDGGTTWTSQLYESGYYYDPIGPFNDVYFADSNHGWVVGDYGAVFSTSNGGVNWNEQDSGVDTELFGVAFTDLNHGWAVGEEGTVITTMDGGTTWSNYSLGTTDYLNSICFADADNGWIAGGDYYPFHGTIFHTNDGGVTWNLQDTGTGDYEYILNDIWFVNDTQGWAAGGTFYPWEAVMLHTENGGGSFVDPVLSYTPTSYDFGNMYNGGTDSTTITIWNSGTGVLNYYLQPDPLCTWISVSPEGGFSSGELDTVTVFIDALGLQPGSYQCNITIYSNGGTAVFPVYVTIIESNQVLSYDPHFYDFGDVPQYSLVTTNLSIWNSGTGTLYYWIDDSGTFCVVEPWSGSSQGEVNIHTVMCFTSQLELGPHQCNLTIYSNGGNGIFTVYVNVTPNSGFNYPPIFSNENPPDNALEIPLTTSTLMVDIADPNGDPFNWSIETQPNIGSASGTGASNGTKTCSITGLASNTTYTWFVNATDLGSGDWTREIYHFTTTTTQNMPPDSPVISGSQQGNAGSTYSYTFMSTDQNNDDVCYYIDWGDGTQTEWTSYQAQGQPGYTENHTWLKGTYIIKAKAKDAAGAESDWSTLTVTMPYSSILPFLHLLERIFERFPHAFPLLRHIFGY